MMDNIRQLMVSGRRSLRERILGETRGSERRRRSVVAVVGEPRAAGAAGVAEHHAELRHAGDRNRLHAAADWRSAAGHGEHRGGPTGNYLLLATTPTIPVAGNNNSISFDTSDPGTYNQVTADWDFRVTPTTPGERVSGCRSPC